MTWSYLAAKEAGKCQGALGPAKLGNPITIKERQGVLGGWSEAPLKTQVLEKIQEFHQYMSVTFSILP